MTYEGSIFSELQIALDSPGAVPLLQVCVVLALVCFWPLARLLRWNPVLTMLVLLSVAPILAFTIPPHGDPQPFGAAYRLQAYLDTYLSPWRLHRAVDEPVNQGEPLANMLLFVPFGFFATLAARAPVRTAVTGVAVPFLIEGWQAVTGARVATAADWLHNSTGALIGVAAALVLLPLVRPARTGRHVRRPWRPVTGQTRALRPATGDARRTGDPITIDLGFRS